MGCRRTDYVMIAVPFDPRAFSEDDYQKYDLYLDNPYQETYDDNLSIIIDGMNNDYAFIGKILAKAIESDGLPVTVCTAEPSEIAEIERKAKLVNPQIFHQPAKIVAFSHFH